MQYIENDYDIRVVVEGDYCIQNVVNSIKKVGSENRCIIEIMIIQISAENNY